ncbi:glycosyltransferase [bacterium]|nr:MAG: glycosyltransferase [bacterium]
MTNNNRINLLGCPIDNFTMHETLDIIENIIEKREITQHVVINTAKLVYMQKNKLLKQSILDSKIINPDGQAIVWASKVLGNSLPERVAGFDLMNNLVDLSVRKGYKIFFFGATEDVICRIVRVYKQKYQNLRIVGYRNGYYIEEKEFDIVNQIKQCEPDILFVAISSPMKEIFLNKYKYFMKIPFIMGVGGSFDIVAGKTKRAPKWIQNIGFEWLFRLIQEPKRMWKRYLITNTIFIWLVFKELIKKYAKKLQ